MDETPPAPRWTPLIARSAIGGTLMGMANLVPGISGGTMLLASGIYPRFIQAIAEITRFRLRPVSLVVLGVVVAAALVSIVAGAGIIGTLVTTQTWIMYSLFIGLTLGGVPVVWKQIDKSTGAVWAGAAVGFVIMAAIAVIQSRGTAGGGGEPGFGLMLVAGLAGASAMILPGISGGYLLLVLGVYVAILDGISRLAAAARATDFQAAMEPALHVVLPVGIGVVVGVVVVSNALKWVLDRFPRATLGVLLGLLLGAVVGLWPFQRFVPPNVGDTLKNQRIVEVQGELRFEQTGKPVKPKDYPTAHFSPTGIQVAGALGLILVGFGATAMVARLGREEQEPGESGGPGSVAASPQTHTPGTTSPTGNQS